MLHFVGRPLSIFSGSSSPVSLWEAEFLPKNDRGLSEVGVPGGGVSFPSVAIVARNSKLSWAVEEGDVQE